ncbi:MAG: trimethylamine methyltransferase family protein, partial [Pseudomonadota bacterium]
MGVERRGGGRRARGGRDKAARTSAGIPQLPWRSVINPYTPIEILNPEQMDRLHDTSIRILSELGIRVMGEKVMALFEQAGDQMELFQGGKVEIKTRKKTVEPRTDAQKAYVKSLFENELAFGIGPA